MFQQFGVCSGFNKVGQLLWRMTTCGFGRKSSIFEFSSLNSFWRPLKVSFWSSLCFDRIFPVQGTERSTERNH